MHHGVGIVDPVDLRGLQDHVRLDLHCAQRRSGVGAEIWIAGAGAEHDDAPLLEMPDRPAPDERLGDRAHFDGGDHAGDDVLLLQRVLQRQRVDDRGEHAHVVAGRAVETTLRRGQPAEDVAAADHECDLHAHLMHPLDLRRDFFDDLKIDAVVAAAAKRLTAELEQHAVVLRRSISHRQIWSQDSLMLNREKRRTVMFSWSFEICSAMSCCTVRLGSRK